MTTLFISDLHLDAGLPEIGAQFTEFARVEARNAEALYILGDLFESWVGDDDPNPHYAEMKSVIRRLVDRGVAVRFMRGNRDFLIGEGFAAQTGVEVLPDPTVADLYGRPVLLSHGDAYCTDDVEYQQVRAMTRDPGWQAMMLARPLGERIKLAAHARAQSMQRNAMLPQEIMDVNQRTVEQAMRSNGVSILLHGHTHRPAIHRFELDDKPATRIVLGDWYMHGSVVRWNRHGFSLDTLPRP
jgi:UDP-2,3-diacylglucosamine hydrolase